MNKVRAAVLGALLCVVFAAEAQVPAQRDTRLASLRARLHEPGKVRLAFYGASHTASDQYTQVLRSRLQHAHGDGGFGWFLPAEPFPYYERSGLTLEGRGWNGVKVRYQERTPGAYGTMGFALDAEVRAHAEARFDEVQLADEISLSYLQQPGGGMLTVRIGEAVERISTSGRTTTKIVDLSFAGALRKIQVDARGPVRLFGISIESTFGVVVDAYGVPGARLEDQLPWSERSLRRSLEARPVDLVALAYGTNESARRRSAGSRVRMHRVLSRWRRVAPNASCLLIGPGEWPRQRRGELRSRPRTLEVIATQRALAADFGCGFFDGYRWMGAPGAMARFVGLGLAHSDYVHFTNTGYARFGEALTRYIEGEPVSPIRLP